MVNFTLLMAGFVFGVLQTEQRVAVAAFTIVQAEQVQPPTMGAGAVIWVISTVGAFLGWVGFLRDDPTFTRIQFLSKTRLFLHVKTKQQTYGLFIETIHLKCKDD